MGKGLGSGSAAAVRSGTFSRRDFLKSSLLLAGAFSLPGGLSSLDLLRRDQILPGLKLGLFTPPSSPETRLGQAWTGGLQAALEQAGFHLSLDSQPGGSGVEAQLESLKQQGMLPRLLVGTFGSRLSPHLHRLLDEGEAVLVSSGAGENLVHEPDSSNVFHQSLQLWQSSRALGLWAAQNLGKRAFIAASMADCGYDSLYAFHSAFEEAGGEVLRVAISHKTGAREPLEDLMAEIRRAKPDFVFAHYAGNLAVDFVLAYTASGLARQIPLAGSSFLVEESRLPDLGQAADGILTASPWAGDLDTPEYPVFCGSCLSLTGRSPQAIAGLGYDAGRLLVAALESAGGAPQHLRSGLREARYSGVSGAQEMSPSHQVRAPIYLRQVGRLKGTLANLRLGKLPAVTDAEENALRDSIVVPSGWSNPYLSNLSA